MSITISFIILVWNSEAYLTRCFESIIGKCADDGVHYEIIAIDNGSSDRSGRILSQYREDHAASFRVISLKRNRGTTYSRNLGLRQAAGKYLCILDSDTELGEGSLAAIFERLGRDPTIGIIAPRLLLPDGTVQHSVKRFPSLLHKLSKIPSIVLGVRTRNRDFYEDFPFAQERPVATAISACWFLKEELVQKVGHLDEKIFYAPEDLDYSLRTWKAGYRILFYPEFTVLHHTQQITHTKPLSKTSLSHFKGLLYYFAKHGGWFKSPSLPGMP